MSIRTLLPAAVMALPFLLVACGDDDDAPRATPTQAASQTNAPGNTPSASTTPVTTEPSATPGAFSGSTDPVSKDAPANITAGLLKNVRAAAHEGYDRIVFEFDGNQVPGYAVEYRDTATACGSGKDLTDFIGGGEAPEAILAVNLRPANAHDQNGNVTAARDVPARLATIERAFSTCDFEGVVEYALALSGEKPFRVSTLQDPPRLVIDIGQ